MEGGLNVQSNINSGSHENDLEMAVVHKVSLGPPKSTLNRIEGAVKETLFPDDPFRQFKNQPAKRRCLLGVQYVFPILEWAPKYSFNLLKSDLISGLTIASLAIPQGISYARLANLPPILGLYSSFVPPLIYAMLGSSKDLAVGTVAVVSLLLSSLFSSEVSPVENPVLYLHLAFTATFVAGIFQTALGIFRLGFIIDFLSHATIIGFMAGAATVVSLQQLKGILGLQHFTKKTDIVSVMRSVWGQTHEVATCMNILKPLDCVLSLFLFFHQNNCDSDQLVSSRDALFGAQWRWETIVMGLSFISLLLVTRYISKKTPRLFWISAATPLTTVIIGSLMVFATHADKHGVDIVGNLKRGLNPLSINHFVIEGRYMKTVLKAGLITAILTLTEGIAVGRTFSLFKNYHIDGNKEMIAIGMMNIVGSCTSCYITTGAFSRSAVNYNAGCKTAVSNIVMATAVMIVLLFLTPLFHYTPIVALSSIIVSAMLGLIDVHAFYHFWKVDKLDFLVSLGAYLGVVFASVPVGLVIAVAISMVRVILHVTRPHTAVLGNIPNTTVYRSTEQYTDATRIPGILILRIEAPIYFMNSSYLRERIIRWIEDEEERLAKVNEDRLQYIILDIAPVASIDTTGINMLEELKKTVDRQGFQLALSDPGADVLEKLQRAKFTEFLGQNWLFVTVGEGVEVCKSLLHDHKPT